MHHKPQPPRVLGSLRACLHRSFDVVKLCDYALCRYTQRHAFLNSPWNSRCCNQIMRGSAASLIILLDRPKVTLLYDTHIWFLYRNSYFVQLVSITPLMRLITLSATLVPPLVCMSNAYGFHASQFVSLNIYERRRIRYPLCREFTVKFLFEESWSLSVFYVERPAISPEVSHS